MPDDLTRATHRKYLRIARFYDLLDLPFEYGRYQRIRPAVFEPVADADRLLDCGVGTGRNIPFYPAGARVTGIDLCDEMLIRARRRAYKLHRSITLLQADVLEMPFSDASFDAATATFLFCVLPEELQQPALLEIARVVRPGGLVVLVEYALSKKPLRRWMMRLWAPWVQFAYGASFERRTYDHLLAVGFNIEDRRFVYQDTIQLITARMATSPTNVIRSTQLEARIRGGIF